MKNAELTHWEEAVRRAYSRLAREFAAKHWDLRFNLAYMLGKLLTDYTLLTRVALHERSVLNIGCCEPIDEFYFACHARRWVALDINPEVLDRARGLLAADLAPALMARLAFLAGDAARLPLAEASFDVVLSFSTIDHIPDPVARRRAIDEMCRVVRPGGYLVLTLPNRYSATAWHIWRGRRRGDLPYGFAACFSPLAVRRQLRRNQMEVLAFASSFFNPHTSLFDRVLRRVGLGGVKKFFGGRFGFLARRLPPR